MPGLKADRVLEAVRAGDVQTLRQHLEGGGDPNLRNSSGQLTLLQLAVQSGNLETVASLTRCKTCQKNDRSSKNGDTALIIAVKQGHREICRHLILLGDCDLNAQNKGGFTALMKASKRGQRSVVLLLLQHGAELEIQSTHGGQTALTLAIAKQRVRVVELLLQFGASLSNKTTGGQTPFEIAWDLKPAGTDDTELKQDIIETLVEARNFRDNIKRDTGFSSDVLKGQYKIVEVIGSGTFGSVFLTENLRVQSPDCKVVVKALKKKSNRRTAEVHGDGLSEAKLMLMMEHPLVVKIIQYFNVENFFCIAMEYCEYGDLDIWISAMARKHRQFPTDTVTHWYLEMLMALNYLHSNRILHRDLKPKNVFLTLDGMVKVGDFGLSRLLVGDGDRASTIAGTVAYMCPEILRALNRPIVDIAEVPFEGYDATCDIWSLGCTLYELCTCKMLFDKNEACGSAELPQLPPDRYPAELNSLYQEMMVRKREHRATTDQLLASRFVQDALVSLKTAGSDLDQKFLQDNRNLVARLASASVDEDDATLRPQQSGARNPALRQVVDSVLKRGAPMQLSQNYPYLQGESISDTVPASIIEALAEQLQFGFPLEQIYRRSLVNLELPPAQRRADYLQFTDDMDACELVETLVYCEMTK